MMTLAMGNREPWHASVEQRSPVRKGAHILDDIVSGLMKRDLACPREQGRRYALYILETSAGTR